MKKEFYTTDEMLRRIIMADKPAIEPDKGIQDRLNYYYMLKQPSRKVHTNSFAGNLSEVFSFKNIGLKASFASVVLVGALFFGNIKNHTNVQVLSDTCHISPILVDSNYLAKDTTSR